jgi:hypothetical protein
VCYSHIRPTASHNDIALIHCQHHHGVALVLDDDDDDVVVVVAIGVVLAARFITYVGDHVP